MVGPNAGRSPSMEGRTIARPYGRIRRPSGARAAAPSMEGRTIARPYAGACCGRRDRRRHEPFNGGPDNCPAIHDTFAAGRHDPLHRCLQWRAGQLPGHTPRAGLDLVARHTTRPDLQWRAGQLPGHTCRTGSPASHTPPLQWRAGQLPGHTRRQARCGGPDNCGGVSCLVLQWRAGQLPGHTQWERWAVKTVHPFNGGPDNCPAILRSSTSASSVDPPSMEGRTIARPYQHRAPTGSAAGPSMEGRTIARPYRAHLARAMRCPPILQWRAGQLPGHTTEKAVTSQDVAAPSMEGRTIARPYSQPEAYPPAGLGDQGRRCLQWRAGQLPGHTRCLQSLAPLHRPSMEGRTIARPYRLLRSQPGQWHSPSMEGRTIARPYADEGHADHHRAFNGGPDNCPAIRWSTPIEMGPRGLSMEGRTIARPYHSWRSSPRRPLSSSFNGGPDNCPAIPICPLEPDSPRYHATLPSMEGRTIARPYRSSELVCLTCPFAGVCERCRKHELRRCLDSVVKLRFACSCKASSGP